jgi:hypothetical protein
MVDRKKNDGAQHRKRKTEKETKEMKQGGSFLKYLCTFSILLFSFIGAGWIWNYKCRIVIHTMHNIHSRKLKGGGGGGSVKLKVHLGCQYPCASPDGMWLRQCTHTNIMVWNGTAVAVMGHTWHYLKYGFPNRMFRRKWHYKKVTL